jgi:hypothetical protein
MDEDQLYEPPLIPPPSALFEARARTGPGMNMLPADPFQEQIAQLPDAEGDVGCRASGRDEFGLAQLLFDLPARGGLWALLAAAPVYASANLILGFAFSALAESQMQAMQGTVFSISLRCCCRGSCFHFRGCRAGHRPSARYCR